MRARIRRRSRSGTLRSAIGSARFAQPRWRLVFLLVGALLLVPGLPADSLPRRFGPP